MSKQSRFRLAVDVGGTFTDLVLYDGATQEITTGKLLTTPADPSAAILEGTKRLLAKKAITAADLELFLHATTLVTNTIIERKGAKTGLIMTAGFRDIIEMGTETRYDIYDLGIDLPPPLVPKVLRREVTERVGAAGEVVTALDTVEAERVIDELVKDGVTAIAVCLLHAHVNPVHERAIGELIRKRHPKVEISLSSEVQPEIREYERSSTTAANAYVQPVTRDYLSKLGGALRQLGFDGRFYVMLSSGGLTHAEVAAQYPVKILESGPAAGVEAARFLGSLIDIDTLVAFDMGGTTAKIGLVAHGAPTLSSQLEVARLQRFKKGSGLIVKSPTVELIEIGAGGGSIARVGDHGLLKVGPDSAGAVPGPVCYGRGGTELTVTDANLVLGYLDPENFAGGAMTLDLAAAERAADALAEKLGLTRTQVAWGVHEIANEHMATAARIHLVERGKDPATFTFIATGGAAPMHAQAVAKKLGVKQLVIPRQAGVMSAVGLLAAPLSFETVRSALVNVAEADWRALDKTLAEMAAEARRQLGVPDSAKVEVQRTADMRYRGQGSECAVPLPASLETRDVLQSFYGAYDDLYGRHLEDVPVQIVNLRVRVIAREKTIELKRASLDSAGATLGTIGGKTRRAYFGGDEYVETAIYSHDALTPGMHFTGPAVVQSGEFSAVIAPGQHCTVDPYRNLVIRSLSPIEIRDSPRSRSGTVPEFDPVFMEISWSRIISYVDEAAAALVRTAFSPIIREAEDYAVVLFDGNGNSLAQSTTSAPSFIGTLPNTIKHFLREIDKWDEGDVVITNDPWMGSGHLQDISMVAPIFRNGKLVAFSGVVAHPPDMGGRWTAENREIYQEGLQIPICKLVAAGTPNKDIFNFIRRNVRVSDQVVGDIHAMIASCTVAGQRLTEFMDEVGLESLNELSAAIHNYSERAIRKRIEEIPDGVYKHEFEIDGYEGPLKIASTLTVRGSDMIMDYAGSSMQVERAINCPLCYTNAFTIYPLICALNPNVPNNEGTMRPFTVTAPEKCLLNPQYPVAVGARNLTGHLLTTAVFGTLAQALPKNQTANRLLADSASPRPHLVINGTADDGRAFSSMFFIAGGMGARPNKDGISCIAFPSSARNTSVEILESSAPIRIEKKSVREDSGGHGRFRGGDGQVFEVKVLAKDGATIAIFSDRSRFPPQGMEGGEAGAGTAIYVNGQPGPTKGSVRMRQGDVLTVCSPGGGGYGQP